eukprot:tig00000042_g15675.t1
MSVRTVRDGWERIEFRGPFGDDVLHVFKSPDGGPVVASAEFMRVMRNAPGEAAEEAERVLASRYGAAARPLTGSEVEATILCWEMLGIARRGDLHPVHNPPRVLNLRVCEEVASDAWEASESPRLQAAFARFAAAIERRRAETFERVEVAVLRAEGLRFHAFRVRRIEHPETTWYVPLASVSAAVYGDARDTQSVRRELGRRHPEVGEGSPFLWRASSKALGKERFRLICRTIARFCGLGNEAGEAHRTAARQWLFLSIEATERLLFKLPGREPALAVAFRRARLALMGADPAEIDLAAPMPPPVRRLALFGRKDWLQDAQIANIVTLLLVRAGPQIRVRSLYPASSDIVASNLRRYARLEPERRKRKSLGYASEGGIVLCPVSIGILLAVDGATRRLRWFDSLGLAPDRAVERAAKKAFPAFSWGVDTVGRLQTDSFQCGIWVCFFAESIINEAATQFGWEEHLTGARALGFLREGGQDRDEFAARNGRFIANRREAFRNLLESALVDRSATRLFEEEDEDVDGEGIVLPASAGRAEAAAIPSSSSSSSSASDEAEGEGGGEEEAEAEGEGEGGAADGGGEGPSAGPVDRGQFTLAASSMGATLRAQLAAFKTWRTAVLEPSRRGARVEKDSTLSNDLCNFQRLLGYVNTRETIDGELTLDSVLGRIDAAEIVMRFLRYLKDERGAAPLTQVNYLSSILSVAGFLHTRSGAPPGSESDLQRALRNLKGQLQTEARSARKWAARQVWIEYEEVLEGRIKAYEAFRAEEGERARAKHLRDALALGMLSLCPARVAVVRKLRIGDTLTREGGRCVVPIAEPLQELFTQYTEEHRAALLADGARGSDPGFIFCKYDGGPMSVTGFTAYFKKVSVPRSPPSARPDDDDARRRQATLRWTKKEIPPRLLRSVVSTWVRDKSAEGAITADVADGIIRGTAKLLAHTPRVATLHYDVHAKQREAATAAAWFEHAALEYEARRAERDRPATPPALEGPPAPKGPSPRKQKKAAARAPPERASAMAVEELPPAPPLPSPDSPLPGGRAAAVGAAVPSTAAKGAKGRDDGGSEEEDGGSSEEEDEEDEEDPGDRMERELAEAENRWCAACRTIFGTRKGLARHRGHCKGAGTPDGKIVPSGVPVAVPAEMPPPPPVAWHLRWISPAPLRPRGVYAALASRGGDPLPTILVARALLPAVPLPSGQYESRLTLLRHYGSLYVAVTEGSAADYTYPSGLVEVEYRGSNGAIDLVTRSSEIAQRLGLGPAAAPSPPPAAEQDGGGAVVRRTGRRRGRPPKSLRRGP